MPYPKPCTSLCVQVCTSLCVQVCTPLCVQVCTPLCVQVCTPLCVQVCTPLCVQVCTPLCVQVCTNNQSSMLLALSEGAVFACARNTVHFNLHPSCIGVDYTHHIDLLHSSLTYLMYLCNEGKIVNIIDAQKHPQFFAEVDKSTGFHTKCVGFVHRSVFFMHADCVCMFSHWCHLLKDMQ